jgi:hypothetical protein
MTETHEILFWIITVVVVLCLLRMIIPSTWCDCKAVENMDWPSESVIDAQEAIKQRERNQKLYQKCNNMFGGDMKFLNACRSSQDSFLVYEKGIDRAYDIFMQNERDGFIWGPNVYLAIVKGDVDRVICQIVYLDDPQMQGICFQSPPQKQRAMWVDYWTNRRERSSDWRLLPASYQL